MAILVNIEPAHECYRPIQMGMLAAEIEGLTEKDNPYNLVNASKTKAADRRKHDLWLLGFMAQRNKWIIEWIIEW